MSDLENRRDLFPLKMYGIPVHCEAKHGHSSPTTGIPYQYTITHFLLSNTVQMPGGTLGLNSEVVHIDYSHGSYTTGKRQIRGAMAQIY